MQRAEKDAPTDPDETSGWTSMAWLAGCVGAYWLVLGVTRGLEILSLPDDLVVVDPFPSWLPAYLAALVAWVLVNGLASAAASYALVRRATFAPWILVCVGVSALALTGVHAWFTIEVDAALGEGGLVWGVIHLLTLTRTYVPGGATDAGALGFRIGQGVALVVWAVLALAAGLGGLRLAGVLPDDTEAEATTRDRAS